MRESQSAANEYARIGLACLRGIRAVQVSRDGSLGTEHDADFRDSQTVLLANRVIVVQSAPDDCSASSIADPGKRIANPAASRRPPSAVTTVNIARQEPRVPETDVSAQALRRHPHRLLLVFLPHPQLLLVRHHLPAEARALAPQLPGQASQATACVAGAKGTKQASILDRVAAPRIL